MRAEKTIIRERAIRQEKPISEERAIEAEKPISTERAIEGEKTTKNERARQCAHHWLFETTFGRVAVGVCKLCGAKRKFRNSYYDVA